MRTTQGGEYVAQTTRTYRVADLAADRYVPRWADSLDQRDADLAVPSAAGGHVCALFPAWNRWPGCTATAKAAVTSRNDVPWRVCLCRADRGIVLTKDMLASATCAGAVRARADQLRSSVSRCAVRSAAAQFGQPLGGGGDPLVGGGQRHPNVRFPCGPVELAGRDENAALVRQQLRR